MQHRLFLLLVSLFPFASNAAEKSAAWNCAQSSDGKEWVCSGEDENTSPPNQVPETATIHRSASEEGNAESQAIPTPPVKTSPAVEQHIAPAPNIREPKQIEIDANPSPAETIETSHQNDTPKLLSETSAEWECNSAQTANQWDCQKTQHATLRENESETGLETSKVAKKSLFSQGIGIVPPAFTAKEEETFDVLKSQLKIDPWQHCTNPNGPKPIFRSSKTLRNNAPIDVKSNYSEIFDNEISSYFGNVVIKHADQQLSSDNANYDSVAKTLDIHGDAYYSDDDLTVHTNAGTFDLGSDQAKLRDVLFIAPSAPLRGHASAVIRDSKTISRYQDVAYTSCPSGNQDWVIHASELKIDKEEGEGTAKNAWLEFKGAPIFYSPYMSFPTDSNRKSGFLAPSFGSTQRSGINFGIPYYFNIAPNYDATFKPRYLTKRGILLAGDFRYLTESSQGQTNLELIPDDYLKQNQPRFFGSVKHTTRFTDKIHTNVDLNYVSDKNYFAELGSALSLPNFSYLKSQADVGYYGDMMNAVARVENYQSIDKYLTGNKLPYRKLPEIDINFKHELNQLPVPLNVALNNEFVYFQHSSLLNGQRSNIKPTISMPLQSESAYITPKASLQYTNYFLSNPLISGYSSQISRTLPIFSTDSGMTFERNLTLNGKGYLNTIEPRLFYLYIPRENQKDIPIFDTSAYDIWFNTLFRENRFSGLDRVQDANQVTMAVSSRLIDEHTGKERAKFSLGNIVYFQDREVQAPFYIQKNDANGKSTLETFTPPTETGSFSNVIGELSAQINDHVAIDSGIQFDPYQNDISRGKAILHLTNKPNEIINIGYRYRKIAPTIIPNRENDIIQSDMSFHYPIYDNWSAVGRWQYSLLYNSTQESFLGIEKENCCWRFRVVGRRYVNNLNVFSNGADVQGVSQTGIFFQVELKGLTGMGEKLDTFLEQNIYGYRATEQ
jgi:LPS-assembly protein